MNILPHLPILGDGELLACVFENLLTNANRYGYDGQFVDINGFVDEGEVVVQVVNYGDSIPPNELPYLLICFTLVTKHELIKKIAQVLVYLLHRILWSSIMERLRPKVV